jgi:hypothetical protein
LSGTSADGNIDGKLCEIIRELPDETIHNGKKENRWVIMKYRKPILNLASLAPEEFPSQFKWFWFFLFAESGFAPIALVTC